MTIQERKVKEKEELRALILESAMKHFVSKGVEQTTLNPFRVRASQFVCIHRISCDTIQIKSFQDFSSEQLC